MEKLLPNYNNKDQLPLYGIVYNAEATDYEYLLAGVKITHRLLRPTWEHPTVHHLPGEGERSEQSYVWLGVQSAATQEALMAYSL